MLPVSADLIARLIAMPSLRFLGLVGCPAQQVNSPVTIASLNFESQVFPILDI